MLSIAENIRTDAEHFRAMLKGMLCIDSSARDSSLFSRDPALTENIRLILWLQAAQVRCEHLNCPGHMPASETVSGDPDSAGS